MFEEELVVMAEEAGHTHRFLAKVQTGFEDTRTAKV